MITGIKGTLAEKQAAKYLKKKGLIFKYRNYRCRRGELDIIMQHQDTVVFVEVRYRSSEAFGGALESITKAKQSRLRYAAEHFLLEHNLTDVSARFDIICVQGRLSNPKINWIQNAF